jgi:hypothetical protein
VDWLPSLARSRSRLVIQALLESDQDRARCQGILPSSSGVDGRMVDTKLVDHATTMFSVTAVRSLLGRIRKDSRLSVRFTDQIASAMSSEWATRRVARPVHLSRWLAGDLESCAITKRPDPWVVLCDESDSMDARGPHGLAGVVWAHAAAEVLARHAPISVFGFGGNRIRPYRRGGRLGGGSLLGASALQAALSTLPSAPSGSHILVISDGLAKVDMAVSQWLLVPNEALAAIVSPTTALVDLLLP